MKPDQQPVCYRPTVVSPVADRATQVRHHLYQNFNPHALTSSLGYALPSQQHACQPTVSPVQPFYPGACMSHGPVLHIRPYHPHQTKSSSAPNSFGSVSRSTNNELFRPGATVCFATVPCQLPPKQPVSGHASVPTLPGTTTAVVAAFRDCPDSSPHSEPDVPVSRSHARTLLKMSEPFLPDSHSTCKRNPPPLPPPRSGSWLCRHTADPGRPAMQSHVHPLTSQSTNGSLPYGHIQSASFVPSEGCARWHSVGTTTHRSPASSYHSANTLSEPMNRVHSSSSSPPDTITDTLLRLLIRHYTSVPPSTSSVVSRPQPQQQQRQDLGTLDRLIHAVCGPEARATRRGHYVDSDVATLAQRILPHLVRIIYTEVSGEGENASSSQSHCSHNAPTSDVVDRDKSTSDTDCNLIMTTSVESRHSCTADDDASDEDAAAVFDVLDDHAGSSAAEVISRTDSEALPPATSVAQLKDAAIEAIHRLVPVCQVDASLCERDLGIVYLLSAIHKYTLSLQQPCETPSMSGHPAVVVTNCPVAEVAALVRLSFYPEHRAAICDLGGVHALIGLLRVEHSIWTRPMVPETRDASTQSVRASNVPKPDTSESHVMEATSLTLRRYICMALTNLTYGVATNKALVCRRLTNLEALLAQLETGNEELKQVAASVLRNLCWRTDVRSKLALRRVNAPRRLTVAAMTSTRDGTLRTTLSALWNLSSHCSHNKRAICGVDGVFRFLLQTIRCEDVTDRLVLIENSGGILRNISATAAAREDYRALLHQNGCYSILLDLLRNAPSLTVIVNVCGTLWNLTAAPHCPAGDLVLLCRTGIVDLLHQLSRSSHELIRNSSTAVLRNLLHPTQQAVASQPIATEDSSLSSQPSTELDCCDSTKTAGNALWSCSDTHADLELSHDDGEDDSATSQPDRSCRRRVNPRAQLRFGLLSVVLEADDADEEEAAEETDDGDEEVLDDEDTYGDDTDRGSEGSIYPDQEALVTESSEVLLVPTFDHVTKATRDNLEDQQSDEFCSWNPVEQEEEQTCVYAEEGTPFSPDSATDSCFELCQPQTADTANAFSHTRYCASNRAFITISDALMDGLPSYTSADALPHVYAVEDTPHLGSTSPSRYSDSSSPRTGDSAHSSTFPDDEVSQLPSPPPDMSHLVSPLLALQLDDYKPSVIAGFALPPPPPPPPLYCTAGHVLVDYDTIPTSTPHTSLSVIETPLLFSRGTPSCPSSNDLTDSLAVLQSSPQSDVSGSQSIVPESEFASTMDSGITRGKCAESVVDGEEILPPLAFSHGDGVEEGNEGEEVQITFAEEGTPQDAISLLEEPHVHFAAPAPLSNLSHPGYTCWSHPPVKSEVDDVDDDDEQGHSHILQECIASAMPQNSSFALRSDRPSGLKYPADAALFGQDDSVQAFAVEDTPFGTSTKTSSISDLSLLDRKSPIQHAIESYSKQHTTGQAVASQPCYNIHETKCYQSSDSLARVSSSSSSSVNGDTSSDLLSEVIQSAMPKSMQTALSVPCDGSTNVDCLQLYAVEGTPGEELSGSLSLRNLDSGEVNSFTSQTSLHHVSTNPPAMSDSNLTAPPAPPLRTSSVLSNQKDPFASTNAVVNRPQAMVAPMPQVVRCLATPVESSDFVMGSEISGAHKHSSRDTASTHLTDKEDASSFSSLLSIESVGLEHSLLQECISSAMPRPKLSSAVRKHPLWHPLHAEVCPSHEVSLQEEVPQSMDTAARDVHDSPRQLHSTAPFSRSSDDQSLASVVSDILPIQQHASVHTSATPSDSSSPGLCSAPANLSRNTITIHNPEVATPERSTTDKAKHKGPLHFLECGSGDAAHPSLGVASNSKRTVPTAPTRVRTDNGPRAKSVDHVSSEAQVTSATNDSSRLRIPSTSIPPGSNLPVPGSQLSSRTVPQSTPSCRTISSIRPTSKLRPPSTSAPNRPDSESSVTQFLLAEGAQAVLAALLETSASDPELDVSGVHQCSPNSYSRGSLPVLVSPKPINGINPSTRISSTTRSHPKPSSGIPKLSAIPLPQNMNGNARSGPHSHPVCSAVKSHQPRTATFNSRLVSNTSTPSLIARLGPKQPVQPANPSRPVYTCPPSANGRSLLSSRSASTTGSQTNLHSHALRTNRKPVSARSICAALTKQEHKNIVTAKRSVLTDQSKSVPIRYGGTQPPTRSIPTRVTCAKSLSSSAGQLTNDPMGQLKRPIQAIPISQANEDEPKPIRGGRKTLTGHKIANSTPRYPTLLGKPVTRPSAICTATNIACHSGDTPNGDDGASVAWPPPEHSPPPMHNESHSPYLARVPLSTDRFITTGLSECKSTSSDRAASMGRIPDSDTGMWIVRGELTRVEQVNYCT